MSSSNVTTTVSSGDLSGIRPPFMNWSASDLPTAFREFKQYCELIFKGPLAGKNNDQKVTYILLWVGQEGLKMHESWNLSTDERSDPAKIWECFERQLEPRTNFRLNRFNLHNFKQGPTESVDDFMTRCKLQAKKCRFTDDSECNNRLIEQLIIGTRHKKVQEVLISKDHTLKLDAALDIARTYEATQSQLQQLQASIAPQVTSVHELKTQSSHCHYCGGRHPTKPRDRCPAYNVRCRACGKLNHFQKVCRSRESRSRLPARSATPGDRKRYRSTSNRRGQRSPARQQVLAVNSRTEDTSLEEPFETLTFQSINFVTNSDGDNDTRDEIFANIDIKLENKPNTQAVLRAKVDTGSQGNILPIRIFRRMYPEKLTAAGFPKQNATSANTTSLTAYNGSEIRQYGTMVIPCTSNDKTVNAEFFIADSPGPAILGLPLSRDLKLVQLNCEVSATQTNVKPISTTDELVQQHPENFEGIGTFQGSLHININPAIPPVVHPPRRCPIHIQDAVKQELDEMERLGVITKVNTPTDWVNSLAYSRKPNGRIRICLDPKDLNRAIKRPHHKTPTLEEITHKLSGATVFSKLDARHGYWSVMLDSESSLLTTFNSPYGRYRFTRLPFGLNLSQDVFQQKMDVILEQCPGTIGIADDVGVYGQSEQEHDRNLHHLMSVARENGLVFNRHKCEIKKPSMKFFGLIFDAQGVHPDPDKITDIKQLEPPSTVKKLQEFLGIATYMSPFIPHLSQLTAPLRDLTRKDAIFEWSAAHQKSFDRIKELICEETTLSYFNPDIDTVVNVDASTRGLGAVLMQNGKPIAFASKSLTDCEQRYANIEREMLAVVFGCEKFHTYLFGKQFVVESDHKPLEMIHLKSLSAAPPRLQRMLLRVQHYDFKIKYKPGSEMLLADALSRSPNRDCELINLDVSVHPVQFSPQKIKTLAEQTAEDQELQSLKDMITSGWPEKRNSLPSDLRKYWSYRDELSVEDGIILKGNRVIIPATLQSEILQKLHESHQGIDKTQLRARTCVYWHKMNADIESVIKNCDICQQFKPKQRPEPLMQAELPTRPWQILGTDLFQLGGDEYLLISDYYSKFPLVRRIRGNATSQTIVNFMKGIFSEYGIPEIIYSDNGGQYDSEVFRTFASNWGIKLKTSSPHYPQSNGFSESQVKIVKTTIAKARAAGTDPDMALLLLRATPVDHHLPSPAELLNSRQLRTNIPAKIRNSSPGRDDVQQRLADRQTQQKQYFDQQAGEELPPLQPGQNVNILHTPEGKWQPATVRQVLPEPRSYTVETPTGSILRRNRRHIRPVTEGTKKTVHFDPDIDIQETTETTRDITRTTILNTNSDIEHTNSNPNIKRTKSGRMVKAPKRLDM